MCIPNEARTEAGTKQRRSLSWNYVRFLGKSPSRRLLETVLTSRCTSLSRRHTAHSAKQSCHRAETRCMMARIASDSRLWHSHSVREVTTNNFGLLIAYLIPGFVIILSLRDISPTVGESHDVSEIPRRSHRFTGALSENVLILHVSPTDVVQETTTWLMWKRDLTNAWIAFFQPKCLCSRSVHLPIGAAFRGAESKPSLRLRYSWRNARTCLQL